MESYELYNADEEFGPQDPWCSEYEGPSVLPLIKIPSRLKPKFAVQRPELLTWLDKKTSETRNRVALLGPPGIGKSQLAYEYVDKIRSRNPPRAIIWVEAYDSNSFIMSYNNIAEAVGIDNPQDHLNSDLSRVFRWLESYRIPWYMIVDHLNDASVLSHVVRYAYGREAPLGSFLPTAGNGSIIFISNSTDASLVQGLVKDEFILNVPDFTPRESLQLLNNTLEDGQEGDDYAMPDFVKYFGHKPGPIIHAAHVINARNMRVPDMALMKGSECGVPESEQVIGRASSTWQRMFENLRATNKPALRLMCFLSLLATERIPKEILSLFPQSLGTEPIQGEGGQEIDGRDHTWKNEIKALSQRDLLFELDGELPSVQLRPMVGFVTETWLSYLGRRSLWKSRLFEVIASKWPQSSQEDQTLIQALEPHMVAVVKLDRETLDDETHWATIAENLAVHLHSQGKKAEVMDLSRQVVEVRTKHLGADHEGTLRSFSSIC